MVRRKNKRKSASVRAFGVQAVPFDSRLTKHTLTCARVGARRISGAKVVIGRGGYPTVKAKGTESDYYKIFDAIDACLAKKQPRGKHPCVKAKTTKDRLTCRKKVEADRKIELKKIRKQISR